MQNESNNEAAKPTMTFDEFKEVVLEGINRARELGIGVRTDGHWGFIRPYDYETKKFNLECWVASHASCDKSDAPKACPVTCAVITGLIPSKGVDGTPSFVAATYIGVDNLNSFEDGFYDQEGIPGCPFSEFGKELGKKYAK